MYHDIQKGREHTHRYDWLSGSWITPLICLAIFSGLTFFLALSRHTIVLGLENDTPFYLKLAQQFALGELKITDDFGGWGRPVTSFWPPLYPLTIVLFHWLFPNISWLTAAVLVSATAGTVAIMGIYLLARDAGFTHILASLTAAIVVLSKFWLWGTTQAMSDMFFTVIVIYSIWCLQRFLFANHRQVLYGLAGFTLLGLANQVRSIGIIFLPVWLGICLYFGWHNRKPEGFQKVIIMGLFTYTVIQIPWLWMKNIFYSGYGISPWFVWVSSRGDLNYLNLIRSLFESRLLYKGLSGFSYLYYAVKDYANALAVVRENGIELIMLSIKHFIKILSLIESSLIHIPKRFFYISSIYEGLSLVLLLIFIVMVVWGFYIKRSKPLKFVTLTGVAYLIFLSPFIVAARYHLLTVALLSLPFSAGLSDFYFRIHKAFEANRTRKRIFVVLTIIICCSYVFVQGFRAWNMEASNLSREDKNVASYLSDNGVPKGARVVTTNYVFAYYGGAENITYPPPWLDADELKEWLIITKSDYFMVDLPIDSTFRFLHDLASEAQDQKLEWAQVVARDSHRLLIQITLDIDEGQEDR